MSNIDLDYGAITIDTSVFDNNGIALERGLLNQLDQFKESPVQVLISETVGNELTSHLTDKIKDSRSKIDQALRAARNQLRVTEKEISDARSLIFDKGDDVDVAKGRLEEFYDKTGAIIIQCGGAIEVSTLVNMYFSFVPPFEKATEKKNEFPDALALSSDKGWAKYAAESKRIDVIDNLAYAISHFQPHNFARNIIESIKSDYTSGATNEIFEAITQGIKDSLDGIDIYIEASSSFAFEEDDVYAVYKSHELCCDDKGVPEVNIIGCSYPRLLQNHGH